MSDIENLYGRCAKNYPLFQKAFLKYLNLEFRYTGKLFFDEEGLICYQYADGKAKRISGGQLLQFFNLYGIRFFMSHDPENSKNYIGYLTWDSKVVKSSPVDSERLAELRRIQLAFEVLEAHLLSSHSV